MMPIFTEKVSEAKTAKTKAVQRRLSESLPDNKSSFSNIFLIQRRAACACGGGCPQCKGNDDFTVSQPHDAAEIEADSIAEKVMRMSDLGHTGTLDPAAAKPSKVQRQIDQDSSNSIDNQSSQASGQIFKSSGTSLDDESRNFFEPRFGHNFGQVKIHHGESSAEFAENINARAFTVGNEIGFAEGEYQPKSAEGRRLLAHELTHVIQQKTGSSGKAQIRRQPRSRKPPPVPDFFIDSAKDVFQRDGNNQLIKVGFRNAAGATLVTAALIPPPSAKDGSLIFGGTNPPLPIAKMFAIETEDLTDTSVPNYTALKKKKNKSASYMIVQPGNVFELLTGGAKKDDTPTPLNLDKLPAAISGKLAVGSRIELDSGHFWVLIKFTKPGERADALHWAVAKETGKQYLARRTEIGNVINTLPGTLKTDAQKNLTLISSISHIEGDFKAKAGRDTHASLGIFQWALDKNKSKDPDSTLMLFFQKLKQRAADASAKTSRTAEEKLFIDAWQELTVLKIDITSGGTVTKNGSPIKGSELQNLLSEKFGEGALQKYQLQGALDTVVTMKSTLVRPRHGVKNPFKNDYSDDFDDGARALFKSKLNGKNVELFVNAPSTAAKVQDLLKSDKAVALAATISVNRTNYVPTALWLAINGNVNLEAEVAELITKIAKAQKNARKSIIPINEADLVAAAKPHYQDLQKLIWINPANNTISESVLVAELERLALSFYKTSDLKKYERWNRLATVEAAFEGAKWK